MGMGIPMGIPMDMGMGMGWVLGRGTVTNHQGPVGILLESLNGCEIKRKHVKYAINVIVCLNFTEQSRILNLF